MYFWGSQFDPGPELGENPLAVRHEHWDVGLLCKPAHFFEPAWVVFRGRARAGQGSGPSRGGASAAERRAQQAREAGRDRQEKAGGKGSDHCGCVKWWSVTMGSMPCRLSSLIISWYLHGVEG